MPSGWSTYYVVLLAAVSALLIPAGLAFIGFFVVRMQRGKQPRKDFGVIRPLSETLGEKTNPRYFLAANCAIVLIMLMLSLVPCVVTLAPGSTEGELVRSLLAIIVISGFTGLGLLYASKKGDLSWLRVTRETSPDAVGEKKR